MRGVIGSGVLGSVSSGCTVAGVGDFNGDGKADVLWRDTAGNMTMWFMSGAGITSQGSCQASRRAGLFSSSPSVGAAPTANGGAPAPFGLAPLRSVSIERAQGNPFFLEENVAVLHFPA